MKITLSVRLGEGNFSEQGVAPTTTLGDLKSVLLFDYPDVTWGLWHKGKQLTNNDGQTLQEAGIEDTDLIEARPQNSQTPTPTPQQQRGELTATNIRQLEQLRQHFLTSDTARVELNRRYGYVADTIDNEDEFRTAWSAMLRSSAPQGMEENSLGFEENMYKLIRQVRCQDDYQDVMENNPELLGRVTMLYVNLIVNGHPVKAFVDSGAQATIISPDCAEACGITPLIDPRFAGVARGVGTARILGRIHKAPVQLDGDYEAVPCAFTVMEGKDVDMLLGLDMLRRYRASIDLYNNRLVFGGQSVPFLGEGDIPKHDESEPTVSGPGGTSIGAKSGALKHPEGVASSGQPGEAGPSSSSQSQPRAPVSSFSGAGRTLGAATNVASSSSSTPTPSNLPVQQPRTQPPVARPSAPTPARAAPSFPQSAIDSLQNIGATREQSIRALTQCGGNVDMAATLLFEGFE